MLGRDDLYHRKPNRAGGRRAEAGESRVHVGRLSPSAAEEAELEEDDEDWDDDWDEDDEEGVEFIYKR